MAGDAPAAGDVLRVAVDATPLLGVRSGIGVVTALLIEALAARSDLRVMAYAVSRRGHRDVVDHLPPGVAVIDHPMPDRPLHLLWDRVGRPSIERWTGVVDVVHGTNYQVPPARGAARVVTVNDLAIVRFPELCQVATLAYPARVRRAITEGAFVHTPSAFVAAEVVALLGANPDRVVVVNYGVPPVTAAPARAGGEPPYILAVGTIEARKDYPTLVRAFDAVAASHPDIRLVIAGAPGEASAALQSTLAAALHRDRIRLAGWVGDGVRDRLLREATLLAYPSIYEGFGLPPLEAMAAGTPVVASAGGALPETLGDGALLVPVGDADALAGALAMVLDDEAARAELIVRGRRHAATYRWDACAEAMAALYRLACRS